MTAFWELSSTRTFGMGIGPIPWNMMILYGSRKGLDDGMMDLFVQVIRELDEAYLKDQRENNK